ncbi:MAG: D-sedoheptulose 7-phosphate isomerase [Thermomicrobiales bacterium]|nr:D-sedoheptulose 7-phosphate isomerase [Thermomicrobiales bacterium]MEA2584390.1 D-sedoheptulose 7-phosphate isomerase [Thermomicrobiales bacterium]MEA2594789.1 D-sedoheptulose 7-phosphate isomerase [Thermomicrobiales bacterium]
MQTAKLATVVPLQRRAERPPDVESAALAALVERKATLTAALDDMCARASNLSEAATIIIDALRAGGRVLIAGNGGSAAEAQHFATELVGRFKRDRDAYAAIALTADTAILTALANDFGYEEVFARQVVAYGRRGDVLVAFSTSGESENLIRAALTARSREIVVVAVTGGRPSRLTAVADLAIRVPVVDTPLAQELHTVVLHVICDLVESSLAAQA